MAKGFVAGVVLACLWISTPTWAENLFYGQMDMYSLEVPLGWTVLDGKGFSDARIVSRGGEGRGTMFVGVLESKGTLEDDTRDQTDVTGRGTVAVNGLSCLHLVTYGRGPGNMVFCQFTTTFADGSVRITFFIGHVSHPDEKAAQEAAFWQTVHSVKWREGIRP